MTFIKRYLFVINSLIKSNAFAALVSGVMVISCSEQNTDSRNETIFLQDSLFQVTLDVPYELDSFYTWRDDGDTECSYIKKYRFSNSTYPIVKETGFIRKAEPDSAYRLTISHVNKYVPFCFLYVDNENVNALAEKLKANAKIDSVECRIYSTDIRRINNRDYATLIFRTSFHPTQKYQTTAIRAYTLIDSTNVFVEYECVAKSCEGFVEKMEKSLKTIKITKLK